MSPSSDALPEPEWTDVDPHLFAGRVMVALSALQAQGVDLRAAIDVVNSRAETLHEADPDAFSNPPPWPGIHT